MNPLHLSRALSLIAYFGLLLHVLLWVVLAGNLGSTNNTAILLLIAGVPLLIFLYGVLHGRAKAHAWLGFISLLYFMHGVAEAYSNPNARELALIEVGLSLLLFFSTAAYARMRGQAAANNAKA